MTDEEINAAIAEACGWKNVWRHQDASETASFVGTSPDNKFLPVTNYCTDLNAMRKAEDSLTYDQDQMMYFWLLHICELGTHWRATAKERAEAFLRTLGKWKEKK
jgi:hypothetical protein